MPAGHTNYVALSGNCREFIVAHTESKSSFDAVRCLVESCSGYPTIYTGYRNGQFPPFNNLLLNTRFNAASEGMGQLLFSACIVCHFSCDSNIRHDKFHFEQKMSIRIICTTFAARQHGERYGLVRLQKVFFSLAFSTLTALHDTNAENKFIFRSRNPFILCSTKIRNHIVKSAVNGE